MAAGETRTFGTRAGRDRRCRRGRPSGCLLTAQVTLTLAGFKPGMTVLAPGIGGSVGNATYQLARAQGAGKVISTAGSAAKVAKARKLGFEDVVNLSAEGLADGVRRMTAGRDRPFGKVVLAG